MSADIVAGESDRVFDHQEVRRVLATVSHAFRRIAEDSSPTVVACRAGLSAIVHFEQVLTAHFEFEEAEAGFFSEVLEMAPTSKQDLDQLRHEHPRLARELNVVVEEARWAGLSAQAWGRVSQRFNAFAQQLDQHEHAEDLVVADVLFTDEGGPG